jgi:hypothetical protein
MDWVISAVGEPSQAWMRGDVVNGFWFNMLQVCQNDYVL